MKTIKLILAWMVLASVASVTLLGFYKMGMLGALGLVGFIFLFAIVFMWSIFTVIDHLAERTKKDDK